MKSIKQQYIDLTEGKMSQHNFMRSLRMTMPQYVTNVTSFGDAVKILKNKGILNEVYEGDGTIKYVESQLNYMVDGDSITFNEFKAAMSYLKDHSEEIIKEFGNNVGSEDAKKIAKTIVNKATNESLTEELQEIKFDETLGPIIKVMQSLGYKGEYDPTIEEGYIFTKDFADGVMQILMTDYKPDQEKFTFTAVHFDRITKSQLFGLIKKHVIDYENGNWVSKDGDIEIVDLGTGMFSLDEPGVEDLIKSMVKRVEEKAVATKGIDESLTEELDTKKVYGGTGQNQGDTGSSLQFTVIEDNPEYFEIDFTLTPNSKYRQAGAGSRSPREKEYGYVKVSKADFDGYITAKGENFYIGKDFITANLQTNKNPEEKDMGEDEFDALLKQVEDEKAGEIAVKSDKLDEPLEEAEGITADAVAVEKAIDNKKIDPAQVKAAAEKAIRGDSTDLALLMVNAGGLFENKELNEAKKKEEYSAHQCNPTELRLGIKTELEHGNSDMKLSKAKEIAYKNIAKDPIYYTKLKLSGAEAYSKKTKEEKAPAKKKKETIQLVDLINGMQKVKMPKAEEKKKLKENQLNEGGEYTFIGRLNSAELKKIYEIIPDIEIDVEQDDDMERTTITSKFYNNKFIEQAVDGIINPPKPTMRPGVDMGKSFEKWKMRDLKEMVRQAMAEMYDGRDNLIDPITAAEEA